MQYGSLLSWYLAKTSSFIGFISFISWLSETAGKSKTFIAIKKCGLWLTLIVVISEGNIKKTAAMMMMMQKYRAGAGWSDKLQTRLWDSKISINNNCTFTNAHWSIVALKIWINKYTLAYNIQLCYVTVQDKVVSDHTSFFSLFFFSFSFLFFKWSVYFIFLLPLNFFFCFLLLLIFLSFT